MRQRKTSFEIDPDEIFLDAHNLPEFDRNQMEGRLEQPIKKQTFSLFTAFVTLVAVVLLARLSMLQIVRGEEYRTQSEENRLEATTVFAHRGVIYDRNGIELAWNTTIEGEPFDGRAYIEAPGFAHVVGYLSLPQKDSSGSFYQTEYEAVAGMELVLNERLAGENGKQMVEIDALGSVHSKSVQMAPKDGENITLSIDAEVTGAMYRYIKELADRAHFIGGAGAIMDVTNGELIALTSYPEYDPAILSGGKDRDAINAYLTDPRKPFLDRVISGLYTPGSIVKPFMAIAALEEGVIDPEKEIYSAGYMLVANPYDPSKPSRFNDWRAHGWVDMRRAIAVSSDVYFYQIGGGYPGQRGMGIDAIEKYARLFGIATPTGVPLPGEVRGTIPNPIWKESVFDGDPWRVGDTYNTVIGQYGFQVTPIQMLRAVGALANNGVLLTPQIEASSTPTATTIDIDPKHFAIAREGMREAVQYGSAVGLNTSAIAIGAKTGTAQVGAQKQYVNSWVTGFFPYDNPRYAFIILMERGPAGNLIGATSVMRQLIDWMQINTPEYFASS